LTESVAALLFPPYEAEMMAEVLVDVFTVAMVKLPDEVPAATVTLGGTDATHGFELGVPTQNVVREADSVCQPALRS
jgi:hypothetical protein